MVLPTDLSSSLAACWGVSGGSADFACATLPLPLPLAGRLNLVTEFSVEFHSQAVVPFLIRSISDSGCGIASRNFLAFW